MDEVFKALADPVRRAILDRLFERGGQTLSELCEGHDMSRFGVMKHLRVLEAAHLVVTRKVGREKLHYLNAVPIQRIHDRWVAKYAAAISSALIGLKDELEGDLQPPDSALGPAGRTPQSFASGSGRRVSFEGLPPLEHPNHSTETASNNRKPRK